MIKLIVSDLDGTLLNSDRKISDYTRAVLKSVIDRGVLFAAASGRFYGILNDMFMEYDENMILVSNNGAWVQRARGGEILSRSPIPGKKIERFTGYMKDNYDVNLYFGQSSAIVVDAADRGMPLYCERNRLQYRVVDDLRFFNEEVYRIGFSPDRELPEKLVQDVLERFSGDFEIVFSGPKWLDIMDKGVTKGKGIEMIQKLYSIKPEETVVFGDYFNDLEMFKKAHYSYAMEHAPEEVKRQARFIAEPNDRDGVARAIMSLCG